MKRIFIIIIMCLFQLTPLALAQSVKVTASKANIRSGPGMEYKVIDWARKGRLLEFIEKKGEWVKVGLKRGKEGWIYDKLVSILSAETLRVKAERENLRKAPGGKKIGELLKDTELKVIKSEGRWVEVEVVGWIWRDSTTADKIQVGQPVEGLRATSQKINGGFFCKNVKLKKSTGMVKVMGEMTNHSGRDFKAASFIISLYDRKGRLLETGDILINHFLRGKTKSFTTYIENVKYDNISTFKIQFDFGI